MAIIQTCITFTEAMMTYSTTQTQVDGLTLKRVLASKFWRINTHVESTSVQHKHDTTMHVMNLNR